MRIIRVCLAAAAIVPCAAMGVEESRTTAISHPAVSFVTAADGLPSEAIEAIVQDRHGYLWIGTRGGLVRNDGQRLRVLRHDPDRPTSLPGNNIMSLSAARDGTLWAGISDLGLVRIDGTEVIHHWPSDAAGGDLPGRFVWSIAEGCDGWMWVAFARGGLARVHAPSGRVEAWPDGTSGLPADGFNLEIRVDGECRPWLMTLKLLYRSESIEVPDFRPVRQPGGATIDQGITFEFAAPDRLIVAGVGGASRFRREGQRWRMTRRAAVDGAVTALALAPDGAAWLAEPGRIARWAVDTERPETVIVGDASASGESRLAGLLIPALGIDAEGGVWIGTGGRGLARLSPAWRGFRRIPFGGPLDLSRIERMAPDGNGGTWLLDPQRGLQHLDEVGRLGRMHPARTLARAHDLRDLMVAGDGLRLITDRSLLHYRPDTGERTVHFESAIDGSAILRFLADGDEGRFWLGTDQELLEVDIDGRVLARWSPDRLIRAESGGSESGLLDVQRGPDGRWWWLGRRTVARQDANGEFRLVHSTERALNDAWLFDGRDLWIAGDSILQRFSIEPDGIRLQDRFVAGSGLPAGRVRRMLASNGEIWLLMTTGLARLDPAASRFRVFSAQEGLPMVRFQSSAATLDPDGGFLAATTDGLLRVDPARVDAALPPPPVHLTSVRAGGRRWDLKPGPREMIDLAWNENSVEFEFVALSFLNPERNRFRVRLQGWEQEWYEDIGMDRRYFGNLSPGRYRFEVQAASAADQWNRLGDTIELRIAPPPWRATPALTFYLFAGVAFAGGSGWAWRRRRRRAEQRRRARNQRELVDAQRKVLDRLTRSLEPVALRDAIVQIVAALTRADRVVFHFVHPGFGIEAGAARETLSGSAPEGKAKARDARGPTMFELRGEHGVLARLELQGTKRLRRPEIRSRLELLRATASQLLDHSLLLGEGRRLAAAAEDASAAKSEFLATVSHEIRTPLHALSGMLAMLRNTRLDSEQVDIVETLSRSTWQLRGLLDEVLDLSRIEAREIRLEARLFETVPMLERVVDLHAANAHRKGLSLRLRIDPRLPALARGDAMRISQVLGNLLSNAVKFTAAGAVELEARLGPSAELVCSVIDTGPGLAPDACKRMFEPFVQGSPTMTRREGGVGLGLAISRRLVDAMRGELTVAPRRLGGCRFVVVVPEVFAAAEDARRSDLIRGLRVAAALPAADRRPMMWLARRWGFELVDAPSGGREAGADFAVLIRTPDGGEEFERARTPAAGAAVWTLAAESPLDGSNWLRAPLNETRLIGALMQSVLIGRSGLSR